MRGRRVRVERGRAVARPARGRSGRGIHPTSSSQVGRMTLGRAALAGVLGTAANIGSNASRCFAPLATQAVKGVDREGRGHPFAHLAVSSRGVVHPETLAEIPTSNGLQVGRTDRTGCVVRNAPPRASARSRPRPRSMWFRWMRLRSSSDCHAERRALAAFEPGSRPPQTLLAPVRWPRVGKRSRARRKWLRVKARSVAEPVRSSQRPCPVVIRNVPHSLSVAHARERGRLHPAGTRTGVPARAPGCGTDRGSRDAPRLRVLSGALAARAHTAVRSGCGCRAGCAR